MQGQDTQANDQRAQRGPTGRNKANAYALPSSRESQRIIGCNAVLMSSKRRRNQFGESIRASSHKVARTEVNGINVIIFQVFRMY